MQALLIRALVMLADALGILNMLQGLMKQVAQEHIAFQIESTVVATSLNVGSPTFGLSALHTQLAAAAAQDVIDHAALVALIAGAQQAINPVILPTIPPAGYGGPSGSSIAGDVWAYVIPYWTIDAGSAVSVAWRYASAMSEAGVAMAIQSGQFFTESGPWNDVAGPSLPRAQPTWPIASILSTDTLSTFIERDSGYMGWTLAGDGTYYYVADGATNFNFQTVMSPRAFLLYKESLFRSVVSNLPPIWPGVANITYGSPTSFSDSFTIAGLMDGVILVIDTVPPGTAAFDFGGDSSYRWMGSLAFYNDDTDYEPYQNLGFDAAFYVPKTMIHAAGVSFHTKHGSTGRVWPYTNNP